MPSPSRGRIPGTARGSSRSTPAGGYVGRDTSRSSCYGRGSAKKNPRDAGAPEDLAEKDGLDMNEHSTNAPGSNIGVNNIISRAIDGIIQRNRPAPLAPAVTAAYATNGEGATITLDGKTINVHTFRGNLVVVAVEVGATLEYANNGKLLIDSIRGNWNSELKEGCDFFVLQSDDLREFKAVSALTGNSPVSQNARGLTILTEAGLDKVCLLRFSGYTKH